MPLRDMKEFESFNDASDWTALHGDTANLIQDATRMKGQWSLKFDKANTAANKTSAGASRAVVFDRSLFAGFNLRELIGAVFYVSSLTNVKYAFIRLGTDATHYLEWRFADTDMIAGWNILTQRVGDAYLDALGVGWVPDDIKYLAVGVEFDAETNTLTNIRFDNLFLERASRG